MDPDEWRSINALLLLNRRVLAELDRDLRQQHGLGVTDFDVLITLYNAPECRLRMSSLAEQVMLSLPASPIWSPASKKRPGPPESGSVRRA